MCFITLYICCSVTVNNLYLKCNEIRCFSKDFIVPFFNRGLLISHPSTLLYVVTIVLNWQTWMLYIFGSLIFLITTYFPHWWLNDLKRCNQFRISWSDKVNDIMFLLITVHCLCSVHSAWSESFVSRFERLAGLLSTPSVARLIWSGRHFTTYHLQMTGC